MAKQVGVMTICEMCGKQVFKEYENKHLGNDIYVNAEYFKIPPGWELIIGVGDVCPECRRDYMDVREQYMDILERYKAVHRPLLDELVKWRNDLKQAKDR